MPIRIELVRADVVTDGVNVWWDAFESALEGRHDEFPLLARVDPYDDVEFPFADLDALAEELQRASDIGALRNEPIAKLQQLVRDGQSSAGTLRFRGD